MKYGIVIIALGYELYGSCAYNLALSLKSNDDHIPVCILHDSKSIAHLTPAEQAFFDIKVKVSESDYIIDGVPHYFKLKLLLNKLTPFDYTIYMDADNIWFPDKKVSWLLGEVVQNDFIIGMNGEYIIKQNVNTGQKNYPFWCEMDKLIKYWEITSFVPQTVSGFLAFRKCDHADKVFNMALQAYNDPNAPGRVWAGVGKSDEYCFNVAMAKLNISQKPLNVFYFDRMDGQKPPEDIYKNYWGLATGGHKVSFNVVNLYDRLVNKYSIQKGMSSRHYHNDKANVIPERDKY